MDKRPLRCVLVSDFNALNFAGYLENDEEAPVLEPVETPFGQIVPTLADAHHPCWQEQPEFALVWTQPEKVIPAFQSRLDFQPAATEQLLAAVDDFAALLVGAAARVKALFVPTWVLDPGQRGLGMADYQPNRGLAYTLLQMNLRLAEAVAATPNIFLLDAQRWVTRAGAGAFNAKLWYQGKVPFANAVFQEAVKDVKAAVRGLQGSARKLILVDLDDTLWGGVAGDVGWENLKLGGHDGMGEAFADFQRALKALTRRGIVLGIVSKNQEAVALEALRRHPEMQLKLEDFAGWRINWQDKAANVIELAAELNLGLQSVVFLDDNPVERARVREAVPEALVPEWPENPMLYKGALLGLRCFDTPILSAEDAVRTQAYVADRQRTELKRQAGSLDEWLLSLDIQVTVEELDATNLPRATQLLNKTNQLNLATRRLTEAELAAWAHAPGQRVWVFRVADKYGDSGLTGLASLAVAAGRARIVDFLLSCRVMGRKVEETMVHWLVARAQEARATGITAEYLPTAKNRPCRDFWERSGFTKCGEQTFAWKGGNPFPAPAAVRLKF